MRFNADVLGQFLRKIYDGFDTANEIEPTMWREILRVINEGTVEGLSQAAVPPTHDRMFYQSLRHSNEVFAAFKTHTMGREMASKLLDASGNLKPFDKWVRDVSSISTHQVGSWLRTEYDTAVIRAHAAADWREFERNKDIMPNLRWMPTTSPDPETSHAAYWKMKLTLPVDHPFWDEHHPGDRWNCKCSLEATDAPATPVPDGSAVGLPQRGLENNPGKDGHTFSESHPYFPSDCNHCAFNKGFKNRLRVVFNNEDKHCNNCQKVNKVIKNASTKEKRMKEKQGMSANLSRLRETSGKEYLNTLITITQSKEFKPHEDIKNVYWMGHVKKDADLPRILDAAKKCVLRGYTVYILPNPTGIRTADLILVRKGIYKEFDLKTIYGSNSADDDLIHSDGQTNRVLMNLVNTSYNPRNLAKAIKAYFESVPDAREVMLLKKKREISITRGHLIKDFEKVFIRIFYK